MRILVHLSRSARSDDGQALAEYALILGVIAMGAMIALLALGPAITQPFSDFVDGIAP